MLGRSLWLQPHPLNTQAPLCQGSVGGHAPLPPPHPPKGHPTSFPLGQDFLSLLVNEGDSCHARCCLSPKMLADKGLTAPGVCSLLIGLSGSAQGP